jgi:hypothetical protein
MKMPSDASGKLWTRVLKIDQQPSESRTLMGNQKDTNLVLGGDV